MMFQKAVVVAEVRAASETATGSAASDDAEVEDCEDMPAVA